MRESDSRSKWAEQIYVFLSVEFVGGQWMALGGLYFSGIEGKKDTSQEQHLYPLKREQLAALQLAALTFHWMRLVFFIYLILKVNAPWSLYCEGSIVERL